MSSIAAQVAKCLEYEDLNNSRSSDCDAEMAPDLPETIDSTGRQSKLIEIKVASPHKKRLLEMESHKRYLKGVDTHKEIDEETSINVQTILDCPWISDQMKAACLSRFTVTRLSSFRP